MLFIIHWTQPGNTYDVFGPVETESSAVCHKLVQALRASGANFVGIEIDTDRPSRADIDAMLADLSSVVSLQ